MAAVFKHDKYRYGDCLAVFNGSHYIGAIMTQRFHSFYCLTLLDFYKADKPSPEDFTGGCFFGTRYGTPEKMHFGLDRPKIPAAVLDNDNNIIRVTRLELPNDFVSAGGGIFKNTEAVFPYYQKQVKIRRRKNEEAAKFPGQLFNGTHLIEVKQLLK